MLKLWIVLIYKHHLKHNSSMVLYLENFSQFHMQVGMFFCDPGK